MIWLASLPFLVGALLVITGTITAAFIVNTVYKEALQQLSQEQAQKFASTVAWGADIIQAVPTLVVPVVAMVAILWTDPRKGLQTASLIVLCIALPVIGIPTVYIGTHDREKPKTFLKLSRLGLLAMVLNIVGLIAAVQVTKTAPKASTKQVVCMSVRCRSGLLHSVSTSSPLKVSHEMYPNVQ
jgi:hypothetical protein